MVRRYPRKWAGPLQTGQRTPDLRPRFGVSGSRNARGSGVALIRNTHPDLRPGCGAAWRGTLEMRSGRRSEGPAGGTLFSIWASLISLLPGVSLFFAGLGVRETVMVG